MTADYGNTRAHAADVAVVRAIYDAFARRDVEGALAHAAQDVVFMPSGTASRLNRTAPYEGHDGIREYFADAARVWEDLTLHADDVRAAGDSVIVFGYAEGTVDGQRVRRRVVWTWRLRDGKAISIRANDVGAADR